MSGLFLSFEGGEASGKSVQARLLSDWLRRQGREVVLTREPGGTLLAERIRSLLLHAREIPLIPEAEALLFSAARAQLVQEVIRPALQRGGTVIADRFYDSTFAYQGYGRGADVAGLEQVTDFAVGGVRPIQTFLLDVPVSVSLKRSLARRAQVDQRKRLEAMQRALDAEIRSAYLRVSSRGIDNMSIPDLEKVLQRGLADASRRLTDELARVRRNTTEHLDRYEVETREFHERLRQGYLRLAGTEPGRIVVIDGDRDEGIVAADIRESVSDLLVQSRP